MCSPLLISGQSAATRRVLFDWDFSKARDTLGWVSAEITGEFRTSDSALFVVAGPGGIKIESPLFELAATPWQYLEIDLKTDSDGAGLVYYSGTTEEPYHGFRPGQYAQFRVTGGGGYRTYTVRPFWQKQGRISHIRIDPPGEAASVRAIRIIDANPGEPSTTASWNFETGPGDWQLLGATGKAGTTERLCRIDGTRDTILLSPPINLDADDHLYATIRVASRTAHTALFRWATDEADGLQSYPIPLRADGRVRSYSLDLSEAPEWAGRVLAVGITPAESGNDSTILLESVALAMAPAGPPELRVTRLGLGDPATRVGEKARLVLQVKNTGGRVAESVFATARILSAETESDQQGGSADDGAGSGPKLLRKRIATLAPGETGRFEWQFDVASQAHVRAVCRVECKGAEDTDDEAMLRFLPKLDKTRFAATDYVPEPVPANTGDYLVGCYYYPGWHTYQRWSVLDDYPERRPLLGYYREGEPEIADWHINWAVSHGIGFFIYDWYWVQGSRQLEHALHDGYLKSRYQDKLKFCLLWANHNPPKTSSEDDLLRVTRYWIDNYFKLPNYLKIDGRNVIVIFDPARLSVDMGHDAVRDGFAKMREMCRGAGVGDLYLVACAYPGPHIKNLIEEGYDALSAYNYGGAGDRGQQYAPYEWMVEAYRDYWSQVSGAATIPYIPVCEPGWDARPWHGHKSAVRTGKSPQLWQKMLEYAKEFVDAPNHRQDGNKRLVFLEAWNEFGEGDYIEPHAEFGFDYLEAVRTVFAPNSSKPEIIIPKDVGMGPYELTKPEPTTAWHFSQPSDQNWQVGNMKNLTFENGVMRAAALHDPAFYSPMLHLDSSRFTSLELKMRMDRGSEAQVFFSRPRGGMTEQRSVRFAVIPDHQWHIYTVDLSSNPRWRGTIGQIRIDPNQEEGSIVEIEYVRFK